ncbi:YesL family protein [Heyndrickxia sp. NPDC080065]|uniref:YesL family protein n=1 Tax=Heyndrickxia sp. NPDC080065 TaxID=3390568 RepID=UPI003CFF866B
MSEQNKFFRVLELITNYAYLNILWFFFSLPVITIFPATIAMFQVIHKWSKDEETSILQSFFHYFKKDCKKGIIIGGIMIFIIAALVGDFFIILELKNPWQSILLPVLIIITLLYFMMMLYFFLLFMRFNTSMKHLLSMAFVLSIRRPIQPIIVLLIFLILITITLYVRFFTILIIFSCCAWIHYKMINHSIEKAIKV